MIEIEYEVKEDMYVSCVDLSLDPERPGCWLPPPPTVPQNTGPPKQLKKY